MRTGPCSCCVLSRGLRLRRDPAAVEARGQEGFEPRPQRLDGDPAQHLVGEAQGEQGARPGLVEPAAPEIEDAILGDLAVGRTVAALDVVGEDLELRLAVHLHLVREEQVLVGLMRVRPDGARPHDDAAVEDTPRAPVQNALVELPARGARRRMIDHGAGVDMLPPADDEETVEGAGGRLAAEAHLSLVPHEAAIEGDGARAEAAAMCLPYARPADLEAAADPALDRVALEDGALAEIDVHRRIGQPW